MINTTKRHIKSGEKYDHLIPRSKGTDTTVVTKNASLDETIDLIKEIVADTLADTKKLTEQLKSESNGQKDFLKNVWEFLYYHIPYKKDAALIEQVRRPSRAWMDRKPNENNGHQPGIDCDCYTVFISSILTNAGIPHTLRITKYSTPMWQHIYVIVPQQDGSYITIDPVADRFNYEVPYSAKKDIKMELARLDGLENLGSTTALENITNIFRTINESAKNFDPKDRIGLGSNEVIIVKQHVYSDGSVYGETANGNLYELSLEPLVVPEEGLNGLMQTSWPINYGQRDYHIAILQWYISQANVGKATEWALKGGINGRFNNETAWMLTEARKMAQPGYVGPTMFIDEFSLKNFINAAKARVKQLVDQDSFKFNEPSSIDVKYFYTTGSYESLSERKGTFSLPGVSDTIPETEPEALKQLISDYEALQVIQSGDGSWAAKVAGRFVERKADQYMSTLKLAVETSIAPIKVVGKVIEGDSLKEAVNETSEDVNAASKEFIQTHKDLVGFAALRHGLMGIMYLNLWKHAEKLKWAYTPLAYYLQNSGIHGGDEAEWNHIRDVMKRIEDKFTNWGGHDVTVLRELVLMGNGNNTREVPYSFGQQPGILGLGALGEGATAAAAATAAEIAAAAAALAGIFVMLKGGKSENTATAAPGEDATNAENIASTAQNAESIYGSITAMVDAFSPDEEATQQYMTNPQSRPDIRDAIMQSPYLSAEQKELLLNPPPPPKKAGMPWWGWLGLASLAGGAIYFGTQGIKPQKPTKSKSTIKPKSTSLSGTGKAKHKAPVAPRKPIKKAYSGVKTNKSTKKKTPKTQPKKAVKREKIAIVNFNQL